MKQRERKGKKEKRDQLELNIPSFSPLPPASLLLPARPTHRQFQYHSRHVPQRVINRKQTKEARNASSDEEPSDLWRANERVRDFPPEHPGGATGVGDGHSDGDDLREKEFEKSVWEEI